MKRLLILAVAIAAVTFVTETNASAQGYMNGYQFGTGIAASDFHRPGYGHRPHQRYNGFGLYNFDRIRTAVRPESQPYFAVNPPVYYSHIVKRPYGVSPFPAPSGIAPIEMQYAPPTPCTITNPYYNSDVEPVEVPEAVPAETTAVKTTWIPNPHISTMVKR